MGEEERIGPVEVVIPPQPERKEMTCHGCKHYTYRLLESGKNPDWQSFCLSPKQRTHGHCWGLRDGEKGTIIFNPTDCPEVGGKQ